MLLSLLASAALAQSPDVLASSRKGRMAIDIQPPAGEHLNEDGPFSLTATLDQSTPVEIHGSGALLATSLLLSGTHIEGTARVPLCENDGGTCRVAEVGFRGIAPRKPATLNDDAVLAALRPAPAPHTSDLQAAFSQAEDEGKLVLIDFGAVWCPPCNMMAAQVLEDPDNASDLEPFVLVTVDADTVESWPAKDRYGIGGYPTVVMARPDGEEVDRMVGYPGEEAMLSWMDQAPGRTPLDPEAATPAQAAAEARRLAEQGSEDDARAWLARAEGTEDSLDHRIARFNLDPGPEDLGWLIASGAPALDWVWPALSVEDPDARAALRSLLAREIASAGAADASDLAYAAAVLTEDEAGKATLYAASAAALRASLTGDPVLDRGQWTGLASIMARAGDHDGAIVLLEGAVGHYPEEFTFHYSLALRKSGADDHAGAAVSARAALEHGYGDNRLRAAKVLAEALHASGDTEAALAVIDETLEAAVVPEEGLEVRTPRYIERLEEARAEIAGS